LLRGPDAIADLMAVHGRLFSVASSADPESRIDAKKRCGSEQGAAVITRWDVTYRAFLTRYLGSDTISRGE
jgi:hypothetical protein